MVGVHVNALVTFPSGDPADLEGLTEAEQERLARFQNFEQDMMGYARSRARGRRPWPMDLPIPRSGNWPGSWRSSRSGPTRRPTLPEDAVDRDHMLTNISLYWFTNTAGSSANLYYETFHDPSLWRRRERGTVPTGVAVSTTQDVAIRRLAEREHNIVHWTEFERGRPFRGHGEPGLAGRGRAGVLPHASLTRLPRDMRSCFGDIRE